MPINQYIEQFLHGSVGISANLAAFMVSSSKILLTRAKDKMASNTLSSPPSTKTLQHWIGGRALEESAESSGPIFNPATGELTHRVAFGTSSVVDRAVAAAAEAARNWREASLARRSRLLFAYRDLVERHKQELATLVTREHGKVLSDALGEVQRGLEAVEFACGIGDLLKGEFSENVSTEVDSYSIRQPLGVVAGITPFNFPVMVPMWMYPLAIACGNTFILKPSEKDPSAANFCAELLRDAGLPDGVFNVLHGDSVAVDAILHHPGIAAVSFVGSTPIARHVYETATRAGKRVQALGGAKNHMVVLSDADLEMAADAAVSAAYGSAGERCMAISVLVAVGDSADRLLPKLRDRVARLKVGPGLDQGAEMGPLVTREHLARVVHYVETGVSEGAELVADGRETRVENHAGGFFLGPCLFDGVTPAMTIYREEIFGPVLSVVRTRTLAEALELVNANPYANGVAIFTKDGGAARQFQNEVQVGMVGINVPIPVPTAYYSFGGWKSSIFGDMHVYGRDGIRFYTRGKVVTSRWPDQRHRGVELSFPQAK
jgi:malonate-semialdehyde dehydrogenase (acetylating)/methylmalonate-semialdehyde dehydrogenase